MHRAPAALVLAALIPALTGAAGGSSLPSPRDVDAALTLYQDGRSWVRETASISILRGESSLPWPRAAAALEPETFSAAIVEGPVSVTGTTPPRRLADSTPLLEAWVGREVELVQVGENLTEKVTRGTLLGLPGGRPLLQVEGAIWVAPPGFLRLRIGSDHPITGPEPASIHLSASGGGRAKIEVSYRTPGLSWGADYRAVRSGARLDLEGWITMSNDTEVDFRAAAVKLLAGEVRRETGPPLYEAPMRKMVTLEANAAADSGRETLGAVHLYTLPGTVDLPPAGRTRRVWIARSGMAVRYRHRLESQQGVSYGGDSGSPPVHPLALLSIDKGALDLPLPAGVVRLFERDASGDLQELGEDSIIHLPAGTPFELRTGQASDLLAHRRQTEERPAGDRGTDLACEIRLANAGSAAVTVEVREFFHGRWKIEQSSHEARRVDARTAEFLIPVPAGGEVVLTYRAGVRF